MKQINFTEYYKNYYKNIPNICFWATLLLLGLGSFVVGIVFAADDGLWLLLTFFGPFVALGIAYLVRFFTAIRISQKVVVADTLLSMDKTDIPNTSSVVSDDTLPEL